MNVFKKLSDKVNSLFSKKKSDSKSEEMPMWKRCGYSSEQRYHEATTLRILEGNIMEHNEALAKAEKIANEKKLDIEYCKKILRNLYEQLQKKRETEIPMVCACWSCIYAERQGWNPAALTEEQLNKVRNYGTWIGL